MISYLYVVASIRAYSIDDPSPIQLKHKRITAVNRVDALQKGREWAHKTRESVVMVAESDHLIRLGFA